MFGVLLRSELIQGSALRTWNCVANIASFIRYKLSNLLPPAMPRSRRRHHSRSRSPSHERDQEVKRRRIQSPDPHHRRSVRVSCTPVLTRHQCEAALTCPDTEHAGENTMEAEEVIEVIENEMPHDKVVVTDKSIDDKDENKNIEEEKYSAVLENDKLEKLDDKKTPGDIDKSATDVVVFDESQDDLDVSQESVNTDSENVQTPGKSTSKKNLSKSERGALRQKYKEERARQRQEKEEQRLKEKKEKEELRLKEKREKEEQRKKEKEEREEQKRKEKEEKEEMKKKEKEEKEEQKRKEREEKEEQKRKEREEKEEQKRKEREQKELKKLQEQEEKNKKHEKAAAAFANFFVTRKSLNTSDLKKTDEISSYFKAFEVKVDMRLAPLTRVKLSDGQKEALTNQIKEQNEKVLYLEELKTGSGPRRCGVTWPAEEDEVILLEDNDIGECVEEQSKVAKMRAKFLKFKENQRPAYFGTWRKKSKIVTARRPFAQDTDTFDYEVDSDDDWEEEEPGESLKGSDDEEKENDPDEYEIDDVFVPHGYLSNDEAEDEDYLNLTPETQKEKLKILQLEFDQEMKYKTERLKPRIIGCIWENKLKEKVKDAITTYLDSHMMIVGGPIVIKKRDTKTPSKQASATKNTPSRKQLCKELIPDFLRLIHGNTNNKVFLVNEYLNYLQTKKVEAGVNKAGLGHQMKQLAKWVKCPEDGPMHNKLCWFVNEDVRNQFNLSLALPNKWSYTAQEEGAPGARRNLNIV